MELRPDQQAAIDAPLAWWAAWLLDTDQEALRQPATITVDVASRWKEIVRMDDDRRLAA